ncbi:hypothetical protein LZG04_26135 [Saccharothrix sp. S26]|uniref:hypothetical protein n=1 Tax=Saccharothrix sp. S26 TaxID=2907215 RepID=UPI001F203BE0|nr:hypothetical protein [Saccharothrix sp. S26]MCE6998251.1 hypothetical protein [Saccharothrix sp. S26]
MTRVLIAGAALVLGVPGFPACADHDRPELIDDPVVADAAESACAAMAREVHAVVGDPVQAIRARNDAVVTMIDAVRAVGEDRIADDRPAAEWLADWRALVDARARHADDLAAGRDPGWVVPAHDGRPITERMAAVSLDCAVPPEVTEGR